MASSSTNQQTTAAKGGASAISTPASPGKPGGIIGSLMGSGSTAGKSTMDRTRRQSSEQAGLFGNLNSLKRGSQDAGAQERKGSLSDQKPEPGVIGKLWNNYTKGT